MDPVSQKLTYIVTFRFETTVLQNLSIMQNPFLSMTLKFGLNSFYEKTITKNYKKTMFYFAIFFPTTKNDFFRLSEYFSS